MWTGTGGSPVRDVYVAGTGMTPFGRHPAGGARTLARDASLAALADAGCTAGFAVQLRMDGDLAAVPPQIVETAYRIVQEGLTNAFRYSGCEQVEVHVEADDDLEVTVLDDGAGGPAADGHGIRGMRERATAVAGEVYAGPRPDAPGWQVRATLPVRRERR